jgi:hypothetical protein
VKERLEYRAKAFIQGGFGVSYPQTHRERKRERTKNYLAKMSLVLRLRSLIVSGFKTQKCWLMGRDYASQGK